MRYLFTLLAIAILELAYLPDSHGQVKAMSDSVDFYYSKGKYSLAIPFARQWVEIAKRDNGEQNAEYASDLNSFGDVLNRSGSQ